MILTLHNLDCRSGLGDSQKFHVDSNFLLHAAAGQNVILAYAISFYIYNHHAPLYRMLHRIRSFLVVCCFGVLHAHEPLQPLAQGLCQLKKRVQV